MREERTKRGFSSVNSNTHIITRSTANYICQHEIKASKQTRNSEALCHQGVTSEKIQSGDVIRVRLHGSGSTKQEVAMLTAKSP